MDLAEIFDAGWFLQYERLMKRLLAPVKGESFVLDCFRRAYHALEKEGIAKDVLNEMSQWLIRLEKNYPNEETAITREDAEELFSAIQKWRPRIKEELRKVPVMRVELQSGLNPDELKRVAEKEPSEFICDEIWQKLTDIEKSDFSDAAKCLLLGTATPAVMVALRGAEASLRNYYRCKTQNDPAHKTWRNLTAELKRQAEDLDIEDTFIGYLDYIGDAKRNFAQHPNKIYSLREAVLIFVQVVALVEDIYTQMNT